MNLGPFVTLPNTMSLARVGLVPLIGWVLSRPDPIAARGSLLLLLLLAFLTDWFDGRFARWTGHETEWGRILDPVADKLFISGVAVFLVLYRGFPLWLLLVLAVRDLLIVVLGMVMSRRVGRVPRPTLTGKVAMCVFSVTLFAYAYPVPEATGPLLWISVFFVALSTVSYLRVYLRRSVGVTPGAGLGAC